MPTNVMLAHKYKGTNVDGWYISEKLDGVRAIWDGTALRSRNNKPIYAPTWFLAALPKGVILDGELWAGRENFQRLVSVVRKKVPIDAEWADVTYKVFDIVTELQFKYRYQYLIDLPSSNVHSIVPHHILTSITLNDYYESMLRRKAEGVMIRNPNSMYEFRRSNNLLKIKPSITDEATVIGYQEGEGKYTNMLGALICQWGNKIIYLGTGFDDSQRCRPPAKKGSIVTFKYQHLTDDNMPRFPVFLAVRNYE